MKKVSSSWMLGFVTIGLVAASSALAAPPTCSFVARDGGITFKVGNTVDQGIYTLEIASAEIRNRVNSSTCQPSTDVCHLVSKDNYFTVKIGDIVIKSTYTLDIASAEIRDLVNNFTCQPSKDVCRSVPDGNYFRVKIGNIAVQSSETRDTADAQIRDLVNNFACQPEGKQIDPNSLVPKSLVKVPQDSSTSGSDRSFNAPSTRRKPGGNTSSPASDTDTTTTAGTLSP